MNLLREFEKQQSRLLVHYLLGKTCDINLIADKLGVDRKTIYNIKNISFKKIDFGDFEVELRIKEKKK